ncbi:MAG: LLM class flavin-dependent oxidoreductase [Armatimonadota bacterium]|nr:LLM class flavin-dependent oxidoreductase [Armatimonadota bacterium]MDR7448715.1 LLM class flavin-dependent oxidoreductase [Armatimonadota bacterium]MDR7460265.1 LLM class flavin-dependent oxidoreductase [Armatimonadota bacterium]MDR7479053.1 LLM class flavin-dependent oxidoreductase [Armatimonadota bacterium]MDR7488671.1 LLM class flavin-dependent oxidoreductase [Armatimonadota bacterium]
MPDVEASSAASARPPGRRGIGFLVLGDLDTRRTVELARYADTLGIPSIWITDEPFFRGAMPTAGACAWATERIRIGLGVVNPYDHPPVWMAMEFAAVDELAGGRAILGVGASWEPPIAKQGIPFTRPLSAVRDTVVIVRQLLTTGTASHAGRKFSVEDVRLDFTPAYRNPRIYVASMYPRSLEQTGELGDGVILSILCPVPYVRNSLRLIRRGAARAGRALDDFEVVQYFPMCVDLDGRRAKDRIKEMLAFFIVHSYGPDPTHWARVAELGEFDLGIFEDLYARLSSGGTAREVISDAFVRDFSVAGTPEECLEVLERYREAGVTEAVGVFPAGVDPGEQLRLMAEYFVPRLVDQ